MQESFLFNRYPEIKELISLFRYEIQKAQRPAKEVVLNDQNVMKMLKISKRKLDYMKVNREIPYRRPRMHSSSYFLWEDLLSWLKKARIESVENQCKF
jgi:hypothetical protein